MGKLKRNNGFLKKESAVEVMASNIGVEKKTLAEILGVTPRTISMWLSDPQFVENIYTRYMEIAGFELPAVVQATIGEAKRGNVQAARLVLEHFGKLENKLKVQVESNFERFMKADDADEAEFFEVTDSQNEALDMLSEHVDSNIELPERDDSNNDPIGREKNEKQRLTRQISIQGRAKRSIDKKKQNERYAIRRRAEKAGLDLLPPGRHSKTVRDNWMKKLEKLES